MGQIKGLKMGEAVEANGSHLDAGVYPIALLLPSLCRNSLRLRMVLGQHLGLSDINRLRLDATLVRERGERLRRATQSRLSVSGDVSGGWRRVVSPRWCLRRQGGSEGELGTRCRRYAIRPCLLRRHYRPVERMRRQWSSAAQMSSSLASRVRNAECADSVTFGNVVSGWPAGSGSTAKTSSPA